MLMSLALVAGLPHAAFASSTAQVTVSLVSDADSSVAVSGASVTLAGVSDSGEAISLTGVSDEIGEVVFYGVPAGTYSVSQNSAPEGYTMPGGATSVTVGQITHTTSGTVVFSNAGHEETIPPEEGSEGEPQTSFVDAPSWYVSSVVDDSGNAVSGVIASQGGASVVYNGAQTEPLASQTGAQTVTVEYDGQSATVTGDIPAGAAYESSQGFSFSWSEAQPAYLTLANTPVAPEDPSDNPDPADPEDPESPENPENPEGEQEQESEQAEEQPAPVVPEQPEPQEQQEQQEQQPLIPEQQPEEQQPEEKPEDEEKTEEKTEKEPEKEVVVPVSASTDDDSRQTYVPTTIAPDDKTREAGGTMPGLEGLIPDPFMRAVAAFAMLIIGTAALVFAVFSIGRSRREDAAEAQDAPAPSPTGKHITRA